MSACVCTHVYMCMDTGIMCVQVHMSVHLEVTGQLSYHSSKILSILFFETGSPIGLERMKCGYTGWLASLQCQDHKLMLPCQDSLHGFLEFDMDPHGSIARALLNFHLSSLQRMFTCRL